MEGTKWIVSRNECYTIDRVSLKPHCKVWYHFLKSCLNPSTHNFTISKERMLLLHSIMIGRKTNFGKIIFREVHHCTQKNAGTLNFTSLITARCQRINVPIQENEDKIPNKGAITKHITMRFSGEEVPRHPSSASTSSPLTSTHATPSTSHNDFK
ncbi:hypothetical protein J1N35_010815 [Gossypium stocksii]|uniref:Putative plant transposon protein domain-containing protein n=1 Tax=Gossypium stocksii TaxID=47602 RepID=A0A9D3W1T2_9ROSI|nr:hypothetical protein J1N35_010815 [Gossypium stocksii]